MSGVQENTSLLCLGLPDPLKAVLHIIILHHFISGTPPILVQTVRNEILVQISTSAIPTSKKAREESTYLFLDLLPKNHGFFGSLKFFL